MHPSREIGRFEMANFSSRPGDCRRLSGKHIIPKHIWRPAFASATEQHLARDLRTVLQNVDVGDHIVDSDDLREAMSTLEYFIPQVLREIHPEWNHESLDAV